MVDDLSPGIERGARLDPAFGHTLHCRLDQLQVGSDTFANTIHLNQQIQRGGHNLRKRPEPRDEIFGHFFDIASRHGAEQKQLQQFIVR